MVGQQGGGWGVGGCVVSTKKAFSNIFMFLEVLFNGYCFAYVLPIK